MKVVAVKLQSATLLHFTAAFFFKSFFFRELTDMTRNNSPQPHFFTEREQRHENKVLYVLR